MKTPERSTAPPTDLSLGKPLTSSSLVLLASMKVPPTDSKESMVRLVSSVQETKARDSPTALRAGKWASANVLLMKEIEELTFSSLGKEIFPASPRETFIAQRRLGKEASTPLALKLMFNDSETLERDKSTVFKYLLLDTSKMFTEVRLRPVRDWRRVSEM